MSTILETHQDPNYEPSHTEIVEYGKWLGMELPRDENLLWIAREGLKAPLPDNWKACKSEKGELYYFNFKTGQSIWDHPLDDHYKKLYKDERENPSARSKGQSSGAASSPTAAAAPVAADAVTTPTVDSTKVSHKQRHQTTAATEDNNQAVKSNNGSLPPSGKAAKKDAAQANNNGSAALPSLQPTTRSSSASSANNNANNSNNSSEDEKISQDGPRSLGKLRELKTLKTKKDLPGELRLETPKAAVALDVPQQQPATATWEGKAPLGKTTTTINVVTTTTPNVSSSSLSSKTPSMQGSPMLEDIAVAQGPSSRSSSRESKKRLVSFSNEEVAVAQEGQKQQLEAELAADYDRYRAEETARYQRLKEDFIKSTESTWKAAQDAAKRKLEDDVRMLESTNRNELQRRKASLSQSTEEEFAQHRKQEEARMAQRTKALKDDIASHVELSMRNLRDVGVDCGNRFLEAAQSEQRAFAASVASGMDAHRALMESQHSDAVQLLQSTLNAERQMIQSRIREIQGECNAKISVMKMDNQATLESMQTEFEERKMTVEREHDDELQRLVTQLRASAEEQLKAIKNEFQGQVNAAMTRDASSHNLHQHQSDSDDVKPLSRFHRPLDSPHQGMLEAIAAAEHSSDDSGSGSLLDLAHSLNAATQTSTPAAAKVQAAAAAAAVAPLSERDLALSRTMPHDDLRSVITEVLRELFKGSPFIVPSPGSTQTSPQVSPTVFGREIEHNTHTGSNNAIHKTAVAPLVINAPPPPLLNVATATHQATHMSNNAHNVSAAPESFQEQRQLLVDERRRLLEAKAFVDNQRGSLEERRAQLKTARRHWKADVMAAKAQGVLANSKKGLLLQKVHKVLDKQTVGLQHDDNLLRDSEHWLRTKEQRLIKLETQLEEHERSRQGNLHDASFASVDTTVLLTGYFKPTEIVVPPTAAVSSAAAPHAAAAAEGPSATTTSSRPVKHESTSKTERRPSSHSVGASTAAIHNSIAVPAGRSISPMLSKALERIERRLDKVALLVASSGPTGGKRSSSEPSATQSAQRRRPSSRSTSRGRHVDFAPTAFADPWSEMTAAA